MQIKNSTLIDAICDNFMKGINHNEWAPELHEGPVWKTYCNFFVQAVADRLGYKSFWDIATHGPISANQIIDILMMEIEWLKEKDGSMAQYHANTGALVIAGEKDAPHGHVCVIRPGEMILSSHWGKLAPRCANVGRDVFIDKGVNFAFKNEPDYFCLKSMLD